MAGPFLMLKERMITMHQTMFPLLIMNILENHATREHPLTITEITEFVNREFACFAWNGECAGHPGREPLLIEKSATMLEKNTVFLEIVC